MAKGDSECSSHKLTPHFAGTERVPLGLRQTGGAAISAIIPASRTIARGWGSWRTPSQPSRSTQWKSGTHGGTRARGSRRVASGRTAQLWTIVKGGGEGGGEEGGSEGIVPQGQTRPTFKLLGDHVVIEPIINF